jgi:hypothetical protein
MRDELVPAIPKEEIAGLIRDLRALHRQAALDFALAAGRMVVDRLYHGDLDAWRTRGTRDGSFRELALQLDPLKIPGLSSSSLQRAVATYDLESRVGVSGRPQLNASHAAAVIGLPDAVQERLLGQAEANDWSAVRLKQEAERRKSALSEPTNRGRPALPAFVRTVNRWERELAKGEDFYGDLDQVADLDDDDAARLEAAVTAQRQQCDALLTALAGRKR